jgi:hypothetical protein
MRWEVEMTDEARDWFLALDRRDQERIDKAIAALARHGPTLGRPTVDSVKGSRHHRMKELRSHGGFLRALFAFDPRRKAIILLGGDKAGDWRGWYKRNVPRADDLYDAYLIEIEQEGLT